MQPWNASKESFYKKAKIKLKRHSILVQLKVSFLMIYAYYAILTLFTDNNNNKLFFTSITTFLTVVIFY